MWADEARFPRDEVVNRHNSQVKTWQTPILIQSAPRDNSTIGLSTCEGRHNRQSINWTISAAWTSHGIFVLYIFPASTKRCLKWHALGSNTSPMVAVWWSSVVFQVSCASLPRYWLCRSLYCAWESCFMAIGFARSDRFIYFSTRAIWELVYRELFISETNLVARLNAASTFVETVMLEREQSTFPQHTHVWLHIRGSIFLTSSFKTCKYLCLYFE